MNDSQNQDQRKLERGKRLAALALLLLALFMYASITFKVMMFGP